jgi:hypothetical protein
MTTLTKLPDTQRQILEHAADQPDGCINWFPPSVKGGARKKVIDSMINRCLITNAGTLEYHLTAEGYDALGRERPGLPTKHPDAADVALRPTESALADHLINTAEQDDYDRGVQAPKEGAVIRKTAEATIAKLLARNSKQATVIQMLQRPEGATIQQIMDSTGWQSHTIRGHFAGALKKKLGLNLTSDKTAGGERTYHVG